MKLNRSRIISLAVAVAYIVISYFTGEKGVWFILETYLVLPLGCIWYGEELGSMAGLSLFGVDEPNDTLGIFIQALGWLLLIIPAFVLPLI